MSEMIERVAQAIDPLPWTDLARDHWRKGGVEEGKEAARVKARAAIEAMRWPTKAMANAAEDTKRKHNDEFPAGDFGDAIDPSGGKYWHAMIDAALNDKSPPPG